MAALKPKHHKFSRPLSEEERKQQVTFSATIGADVKAEFEKWVKTAGWTKKQATEFLIEYAMERVEASKANQLIPGQHI